MRSGLQGQLRERRHRPGLAFEQIVAAARLRHFRTAVGDAPESFLSSSSYMPYHPFTDGKMKQRGCLCCLKTRTEVELISANSQLLRDGLP